MESLPRPTTHPEKFHKNTSLQYMQAPMLSMLLLGYAGGPTAGQVRRRHPRSGWPWFPPGTGQNECPPPSCIRSVHLSQPKADHSPIHIVLLKARLLWEFHARALALRQQLVLACFRASPKDRTPKKSTAPPMPTRTSGVD